MERVVCAQEPIGAVVVMLRLLTGSCSILCDTVVDVETPCMLSLIRAHPKAAKAAPCLYIICIILLVPLPQREGSGIDIDLERISDRPNYPTPSSNQRT